MDTAIERDFAGGRFTFWLPLSAILAVERGPVTPALRSREYPVSIYQLYDEISAGIALDGDGNAVRLPGGRVFAGDVHNILERALLAGNCGTRDGHPVAIDSQVVSRLVNDNLDRSFEACTLLAWDVLHATIKGVSLKKSPEQAQKPKRRGRSAAAS